MPTSLTLQATHIDPIEWLWVVGALLVPAAVASWLVLSGRPREGRRPMNLAMRAADSLERVTGVPAWCSSGVLLQTWAMLVAGFGLFWDVAWHIDLGRDTELFTPPHVLVLLGLGGFAVAGAVSCAYATLQSAPSAWRVGRFRVPRGAAALLVLGITAGIGFPLDDLWHATYGIDVTMWSPTHLMMIGAGALSPFAAWILLGEAGPGSRRPRARSALVLQVAVSCLLALSVLQLEFDDGVPQWQAIYQPVLIAISATLPLVAVRVAAGRGTALLAALAFIGARVAVGLIVGPGLGQVAAHFPLYLGIALCVELAFTLTARRGVLVSILLAGLLAGTVGLASEWGFSQLFGREPWQLRLLPAMWLPALAALAAAIAGGGFALAVSGRRVAIPRTLTAAAAIALVAALIVPLTRSGIAVSATVLTAPAGPRQIAVDRYGQASLFQMVRVEVDVAPRISSVLRDGDWLWVTSWQGGGRRAQSLVEVAPGRWIASQPVPTGAAWKTIVLFGKGDVVAAVPVALPADPALGLKAIPVQSVRSQDFVPASHYLMRESHTGAQWPAVLAYTAWLSMVATWLALIAGGAISLARSRNAAETPEHRAAMLGPGRFGKRALMYFSR